MSVEETHRLLLHAAHRVVGATWIEDLGYEVPRSFGDPASEQTAIATSVGLIDESYRGVVDLIGDGVAGALEKIVSSTVGDLTPGHGHPSCLLSAKGRLVGAFHLFLLEGGTFRLVFREPLSEPVRTALERYLFLSDIEVVPQSDLALLALQGPRAAEALRSWQPALRFPEATHELVSAGDDVVLLRGGQTPQGGFELWVRVSALERVWCELRDHVVAVGGSPVGQEATEALRVEAGLARAGKEYTVESFPNEVGWEPALKYDKCYVGQEVVARMRTYGQVHQKLKGLILGGPTLPAVGAVVQVDGQDVGVVTSAVSSERLGRPIALALIKRKAWSAERATVVAPEAPLEAGMIELPFVPVEKSGRTFPDKPVS